MTVQEALPRPTNCSRCGVPFSVYASGMAPGYGRTSDSEYICYGCCGDEDREWLRTHNKAMLYLTMGKDSFKNTTYEVSNWPGTMKFKATGKKGYHNIAGTRYDVWFRDMDGNRWHGYQIGDNTQIVHCKKLKRK